MNHSLKITYFSDLIDKRTVFTVDWIGIIVAHEIKIYFWTKEQHQTHFIWWKTRNLTRVYLSQRLAWMIKLKCDDSRLPIGWHFAWHSFRQSSVNWMKNISVYSWKKSVCKYVQKAWGAHGSRTVWADGERLHMGMCSQFDTINGVFGAIQMCKWLWAVSFVVAAFAQNKLQIQAQKFCVHA